MADYATNADFYTYAGLTEAALSAAEVAKLLRLAERDVDRAAGPRHRYPDGHKFDVPNMDAAQRGFLNRATCAQAEFRLQVGPNFFIEDQRESTSGPDYSETGRLPRFGPKAREEMEQGGLLRLTGRLR